MKRLAYLSHERPASEATRPEVACVSDLNEAHTRNSYDSLFFYVTCMYAKSTLDVQTESRD